MAFLLLIGPVVFVGVIVHGALGVQVRRQTVSDMVSGTIGMRRYLNLAGPAILVALGMEVGFIAIALSPLAADSWREIAVAIPWVLIAGAAAFLWLASYRYLVLNTYKTRVGENVAKTSDRSLAVVSTVLLVIFSSDDTGEPPVLRQWPGGAKWNCRWRGGSAAVDGGLRRLLCSHLVGVPGPQRIRVTSLSYLRNRHGTQGSDRQVV